MKAIGFVTAAGITGSIGLVCDDVVPSRAVVMVMHASFAGVTCAAICLALIPKARSWAGTRQWDLYRLTRSVTHQAYILLYGLALVQSGLTLSHVGQGCALCHAGSGAGPMQSLEGLQFYIVSCLVPLWVIRAFVLAIH